MRAQMLAVLLGGLCVLGVAGCGKSQSNDGGDAAHGGGGAVDAGDRDQFLAQLCAEFSSCCEAAGRPSDGAQCRAFYGAFTSAFTYDKSAAQTCLDEVRAASDKCDTSMSSSPSCRKVFAPGGTKQPGETCDTDNDCAPPESGSVQCAYDFKAEANTRKCQVQLPGKAGSTPCVGTRDGAVTTYSSSGDTTPLTGYICDVADGISCSSSSGACETLAPVGEACTGSCVSSAYCAFPDDICKERVALDLPCQDDEECVAGAYCDKTSKTCTASRAVGEACTVNAECETRDCTNQKCAAGNDLAITLLCGTN